MMKPRAFAGTAVLVHDVGRAACNRTQTDQEAERAAEQVKGAAAQAGEKLADGWLTAKIQAQFFADEDVKSRYINVSARDGVVKLKGFVESDDARRQVLEITRNTDGVKQIDDQQLLVGRPANQSFEIASTPPTPAPVATTGVAVTPAPPDDATVVSLIQARYFLDPTIKARHIDVQVADRVATLARTGGERERARAGAAPGALDPWSAAG